MAKVSVIIPVYNAASYLGAAIESVLAQTYTDYEILVVDDGSTDESGAIAASYPNVRLFSREHSGIPKTRNFAVTEANGEWIAFLDADDTWLPNKLELQMKYLEEHPECEIVFCRYQNFTEIPESDLTEGQKKLLDKEIDYCLTAAVIKKSLFERFGLFNPDCAYAEDTEWTARLIMGKVNVSAKLDQFLYRRRVHNNNITLAHNENNNQSFYASLADSIRNRMKQRKQSS